MKFSIVGDRDPFLHVSLQRGEVVHAESGAMVTADRSIEIKGKMQGGLLSAVTRKLANGESFFTQHLEAGERPGDVLLAPALPGDINVIEVGPRQYCLNDGAFLASEPTVGLTVRFQGLVKGFLGDTGGFFIMESSGHGQLAIAGFGSVFAMDVTPDSPLTVDNAHVLAWDSALTYSYGLPTRNTGFLSRMVNSVTSGEGLILNFSGQGKVYVCSRNPNALATYIASQIAAQKGA